MGSLKSWTWLSYWHIASFIIRPLFWLYTILWKQKQKNYAPVRKNMYDKSFIYRKFKPINEVLISLILWNEVLMAPTTFSVMKAP